MGDIDFCSEQSDFILSDQLKHSDWLVELIAHHGFKCGDLSIIFCSDDYLLNMNIEHLDHDYYTDVITFNYVQGEVINGDIFISVDRVEDNAKEFPEHHEFPLIPHSVNSDQLEELWNTL